MLLVIAFGNPLLGPAIDTAAKTIRFSVANTSGRSFADGTFINGYPQIEMHSCYDLPTLVRYHKTLIGGSTFYPVQGLAEEVLLELIRQMPDVQFDIVTTAFSMVATRMDRLLPPRL